MESPNRPVNVHTPRRVFVALFLTALAMLGGLVLVERISRSIAARDAPLVDATMEIRLETERAYIAFHEAFDGDSDISVAFTHIDIALAFTQVMLEGGSTSEGECLPLKDAVMRENVQGVRRVLVDLRASVQEFQDRRDEPEARLELAREIRDEFRTFIPEIDRVETDLQEQIRQSSRLLTATLISLVLIGLLMFLGTGLLFRHSFGRIQSLAVQLMASNEQLDASNQQLMASEQQLKASNQQLQGTEQQLRAINQQLVANEQQLRASNQQLQAGEKELRKEKDRVHGYLEVAGVILMAMDAQGTITMINRKGCELLGYQEHEIVGRNWFNNFLPERQRGPIKEVSMKILAGEVELVADYENPVLTSSGEQRLIAWHNVELKDEDGNISGYLSSGEDITLRKEMEQREQNLRECLVRSERMESLGVLAGGVAHDLNNVLGPMVALPDVIISDIDGLDVEPGGVVEEIKDALGVIKRSARRAAEVVKDLVTLGRRVRYTFVPLDINALSCVRADRSLDFIRAEHPELTIKIDLDEGPFTILGEEFHMERVLRNLVQNAAEAVTGKGTVTIRTYGESLAESFDGYQVVPPGEYCVVEVSDTGCGIDSTLLDRIFEPFFSGKKKDEQSGSGLGLSVVHGIVKDHRGFIDVRSEPGKGTTFALYFPAAADSEVKSKTVAKQQSREGNEYVLVVDDEPGQRFLVQKGLARLGYSVTEAENGRVAVALFKEAKDADLNSPFHVVLLDMIMEEDFDGLSTLEVILSMYPQQKVIIVSGHAEGARLQSARQLDTDWLAKPYALEALAESVRKRLDRD